MNDFEKLWNETPEKGLLPKDVKERMWGHIENATLKKRKKPYRWMVAASVAVLALLGSYLFFALPVAEAKIIVTNTYPQDIRLIRLPDGSRVWVNENTEISYPSAFVGDTREVKLTGEAFFEVVKNPDKPFIITSGTVSTTVLGTSFNISAYAGRPTEIRVRSGKVKVQSRSSTLLLEKGNAAVAHWDGGTLEKKIIENAEPQWKKALLDIDGLTLEAIIAKIQTVHKLQVVYASEDLRKLKVKGTLDTRQGVAEMMQTVAFALGLEITSTDGQIFTVSR